MKRWTSEFMRRFLWVAVAVVGLQASCATSIPNESSSGDSGQSAVVMAENGQPVGWTEETRSKDATADYAVVFPQGKVNRIDVTISASDWQAMLDDMTATYGQFGQGRQGGNGVPDALGGPGQGNVPPTIPTDMSNACRGCRREMPAPCPLMARPPRGLVRRRTAN